LLRLSYDTGRHRIGALLTMLALIAAGVAVLALAAVAAGSASLPGHSALIIAAPLLGLVALWFDRAYRRPAFRASAISTPISSMSGLSGESLS